MFKGVVSGNQKGFSYTMNEAIFYVITWPYEETLINIVGPADIKAFRRYVWSH